MATPRPRLQAIRLDRRRGRPHQIRDGERRTADRRRARRRQERRLRRHGLHHGICRARSRPRDEVVEDKGVRVLIDPKAVLFLIGTEMDYKTEKLVRAVRVQQSEPDLRLRLRRISAAQARGRGALGVKPPDPPWLLTIPPNTIAGKPLPRPGICLRHGAELLPGVPQAAAAALRQSACGCGRRRAQRRLAGGAGPRRASIDFSPSAQQKAARPGAATRRDPHRSLQIDVHACDYPVAAFDVVVEIFTQFSTPAERGHEMGRNAQGRSSRAGLLIIQGYTPKQLQYWHRRPEAGRETLYTRAMLEDAFGDLRDLTYRGGRAARSMKAPRTAACQR